MSRVCSDNFIVIQGWMVTELNLKGNELLVYAVIYGFSQDDESKFTGSRQYLADWCNCSVRSIQTALNNLVEAKHILKYEHTQNGVKSCSYAINFTGSENFSRGSEEISHNNIVNNIDNNSNIVLSKDNTTITSENFLINDTKKSKPNLYQKCSALIEDRYSRFTKVKSLLYDYLDLRLEIAKNEGKQFYANMWVGILNDLDEVHKQGFGLEPVIQQSITKGYKSFYPLNNYSKPKNPDTNVAPQQKYSSEEEKKKLKAKNADGTDMKF